MRIFFCALIVPIIFGASNLVAQTSGDLPPNTIECGAFVKRPNGNWYAGQPTTFDIGTTKRVTVGNQEISPRAFNFGGTDLYTLLERKCGGSRL
jgi:hypothetical protein